MYCRGQSLCASRRNTSLRSGSCHSAEQPAQQFAQPSPRTGAKQSFPLRGKWPAGSIGELLAVAFLLDERRNARALRDAFRLQRAAKCGRRGRERNAARSRLAKGIFSFGMKPDERAKRALLERRPFARKLARKKSLLNARRQRSAYAPSSPTCIAAGNRCAPPGGIHPSARALALRQNNQRSNSRSLLRARARSAGCRGHPRRR